MTHIKNANRDNHRKRKNVATDKTCILWRMALKFRNSKFSIFLFNSMSPLELRSQWSHPRTNKTSWIRLSSLISLETKTTQKICSKATYSVFLSKFICNHLINIFITSNHQQKCFYNFNIILNYPFICTVSIRDTFCR